MNTPICDFVNRYKNSGISRFHMPGHKGKSLLGFEGWDITEISGADSLFDAEGIIQESEKNASSLFGCDTFYSAEGSSLAIRAMLYLVYLYARKNGKSHVIAAGRNAHKAFVNSAAVIGFETEWIYGNSGGYLSCEILPCDLDKMLSESDVCAVYITSPDYLGNVADIRGISEVCKKHGCLCIVDNAHGAYLKFLETSQHPIDLGADMCCDSAHKTLPALTGGAYLHISKEAPVFFKENAKHAMALFGSTSPSYLILQSLDTVNAYIYGGYRDKLSLFVKKVSELKKRLIAKGYSLVGDETLKITVAPKTFGYRGAEFADELRLRGIECEFSDPDFTVLMLTLEISDCDLAKLESAFMEIQQKNPVMENPPRFFCAEKKLSIKDAVFSEKVELQVSECTGRIMGDATVGCPPAVPIVVSGEVICDDAIECFKYYGIDKVKVVVD